MMRVTDFSITVLRSCLIAAGCLGLVACGGATTSKVDTSKLIRLPPIIATNSVTVAPAVDGGLTLGETAVWARGFVTEFQDVAVNSIRKMANFRAHKIDGVNEMSAIRLEYAHSVGLTGQGQTIAIVDNGIRQNHDAFSNKSITFDPNSDFSTVRDHGTAVASVAAGVGDGSDPIGVAPGANLYIAARSFEGYLDWEQETKFVQGAQKAGAVALTNSWGLADGVSENYLTDYFTHPDVVSYLEALQDFAKQGVIVFALSNDPTVETALRIAALPEVFQGLENSWITVVDAEPQFNDTRIYSAERMSGACFETARYCLTGRGLAKVADSTSTSKYKISEGTSFVVPQVAGAVALLSEAFPDLNAAEIRARLLATADNSFFPIQEVMEFAPGVTHGYGWEFGHGFMDLRAALLPIGSVAVPMSADGRSVEVSQGQRLISSSPLSGNALDNAMQDVEILAMDALAGRFNLSGKSVVSNPVAVTNVTPFAFPELAENGIKTAFDPWSFAYSGSNVSGLDVYDAIGFDHQTMMFDDLSLRFMDKPDDSFGLGIAKHHRYSNGTLIVGANVVREQNAVLGMTTDLENLPLSATSGSLDITWQHAVSAHSLVQFMGMIGHSMAQGGEQIGDFRNLSFGSAGVSLVHQPTQKSTWIMSMVQPAALRSGSMSVTYPSFNRSRNFDTVQFDTQTVSMAAQSRQLDLSVQYLYQLSNSARVGASFARLKNVNHQRNHMDTVLKFGFEMAF